LKGLYELRERSRAKPSLYILATFPPEFLFDAIGIVIHNPRNLKIQKLLNTTYERVKWSLRNLIYTQHLQCGMTYMKPRERSLIYS